MDAIERASIAASQIRLQVLELRRLIQMHSVLQDEALAGHAVMLGNAVTKLEGRLEELKRRGHG